MVVGTVDLHRGVVFDVSMPVTSSCVLGQSTTEEVKGDSVTDYLYVDGEGGTSSLQGARRAGAGHVE